MPTIDDSDRIKPTKAGRADVVPTYKRPRHNAAITALCIIAAAVFTLAMVIWG